MYTWNSPDKRTRNQIDYIVLNQKWKSCIKNARTRPGADCNSDHQLLTIDIKIRLKKMERPTPPLRLDYKTLDNSYRIAVSNKFELLNQCEDDKTPNELWEKGKELLLSAAKETIAKKKKTNSPWISEETLSEIEARRYLKSKGIHNPVEEVIYKNQNAKIQKLLRRDKEKYLNEQCQRIENCSINQTTKELYQGVRKITRKFKPTMDTIKTEDGLVLCDGKDVKDRWNQYCSKLYKKNEDLTTASISLNDSEDEPPPLLDEVRKAIKELKNDKSPGIDEVAAELIKNAGESVEYFFYKLCMKIWNERRWPEDWVKSVFIPIPKKGDTLQCSNNRTIALISHSSKILLKIIAERMKLKLREEIADEQAGFRPGKGTRNQILNLKLVIEKNREHQRDLYLCFIDYSKAFDTVDHDILWSNMNNMKFPKHIIQLIKAMYDQQQATVRTTYGLTDWFEIKQGVRQGCILSPHLFNIYSETIMRNALENFEGTVDVGGYKISNLRYADDIVLIASNMNGLQQLLDKVREASEKAGLFLNAKKTKTMMIQRQRAMNDDEHVTINGVAVENVKEFTYLGAVFTNTYDDSLEIKRRIAIAKNATVALNKIWKDRSITLKTKLRLLNSLVFPIASYGSECWVLKKKDKKRVNSFELWCYRRVLRISWTEKKTNDEVLRRITCKDRLLDILNRRKLKFVGHVMRSESLEKNLLTGMVIGNRRRGRPKTRLSDNIKDICGLTMVQVERKAQDRVEWRRMVERCTAAQS